MCLASPCLRAVVGATLLRQVFAAPGRGRGPVRMRGNEIPFFPGKFSQRVPPLETYTGTGLFATAHSPPPAPPPRPRPPPPATADLAPAAGLGLGGSPESRPRPARAEVRGPAETVPDVPGRRRAGSNNPVWARSWHPAPTPGPPGRGTGPPAAGRLPRACPGRRKGRGGGGAKRLPNCYQGHRL